MEEVGSIPSPKIGENREGGGGRGADRVHAVWTREWGRVVADLAAEWGGMAAVGTGEVRMTAVGPTVDVSR